MAALSLTLTAAGEPDLQAVLQQLAANTPPAEPGLWPLAIGYWLLLILLLLLTVSAVILYRNRHWLRAHRQLKRLQQLSDTQRQCQQAHQLLRWVRIELCQAPADLSAEQFAQCIEAALGCSPDWLNSHYQAQATAPDFKQLHRLLRQWRREVRR